MRGEGLIKLQNHCQPPVHGLMSSSPTIAWAPLGWVIVGISQYLVALLAQNLGCCKQCQHGERVHWQCEDCILCKLDQFPEER